MSQANDSFSFECPRCQLLIAVGREDVGRTLVCKNCGGSIIVPGSSAAPRSEFDDLFLLEDRQGDEPAAPATAQPVQPSSAQSSEDEIWELMPDESSRAVPAPPAADPFAADDDAPLHLDGISDATSGLGQFRVKCPICDSYIFATPEQIGQKLQCSDCFSMIPIVAPKSETPAPKVKPLDQSTAAPKEPDAIAFPELDRDLPPEQPGDEYGLAPASEDLLQPRDAALPQEILDLVHKSYAHPSPASPLKDTTPGSTSSTAGDLQSKTKSLVDRNPTIMPTTEAELPYVAPPPAELAEEPLSEQFKWPQKFLVIFTDVNVLQYMGFVAILLIIGNLVGLWGSDLANFQEHANSTIRPYRAFGLMIVNFSWTQIFLAMVIAGIMINQIIEGAAYKRSLFHPPELSLSALVDSFLVVGVSFWAGMLPGLMIGNVVHSITQSTLLDWIAMFGTAFCVAPIGILAAYYNGSAFQIYSPEVLNSLRTHTAGWMRFFAWMALWIVLFCLSGLLRFMPPVLVGVTLAGIAQAACLVLVGRTIGLLAQAFINFWIDAESAKTKAT